MSQQVSETYTRKWLGFTFNPSFQKKWFLQRYGFTPQTLKDFVKDKTILDAGCGVGWYAKWMKELGAKEVYAVDFSDSVHKANAKEINVIKASINSLPFHAEFDWVNCDQVIHHTKNPFESFTYLLKYVKLEGFITIYVYKRKTWLHEAIDDVIRSVTTRSHKICLLTSMFLTRLGYLLTKINLTMQRLVYWNVAKCYWNAEQGWTHSLMTNYDWYSPQHAHRYSPSEVLEWFKTLKITWLDVSKSGISVKAKLASQ